MTVKEILRHLFRRDKPPELAGQICPACGKRVDEPAQALKFDHELYHAGGCHLTIPTVLRRRGQA